MWTMRFDVSIVKFTKSRYLIPVEGVFYAVVVNAHKQKATVSQSSIPKSVLAGELVTQGATALSSIGLNQF